MRRPQPAAPARIADPLTGATDVLALPPIYGTPPPQAAPTPQSQPAQPAPTGGPSPSAPSAWAADPGYQAALAAQTQGQASLASQTQASIDQLLGQFGDPGFASWAGFNDPAAQALASQTTRSGNSILAQLQQQHDLARKSVVDTLAAHGILGSGDLGYRTGLADQAYGRSVYGAEQSLLQQIAGLQNTQLSGDQNLSNNVVAAIQAAYQNYINNPGLYAGSAGTQESSAAFAPNAHQLWQTAAPPAASANTPAAPISARAPAHRAVARHLANPYVTGQKLYG